MLIFISDSVTQTLKIAEEFAKKLKPGDVVALFGDLGAGKTHFTRGISESLGFSGDVFSPTFSIVNEYLGGKYPVYHFDMYRISSWDDLYSTGYEEYLEAKNGVLVIEWADNILSALPENRYDVTIKNLSENKRQIIIEEKV